MVKEKSNSKRDTQEKANEVDHLQSCQICSPKETMDPEKDYQYILDTKKRSNFKEPKQQPK